jgi:hypothetical protein
MSGGSVRPNSQMALPGLGIPVDPWTGHVLPPIVTERLKKLKEAELAFRLVLHELDGTTEGSRPGNRHMARAFDKLDDAVHSAFSAIMSKG